MTKYIVLGQPLRSYIIRNNITCINRQTENREKTEKSITQTDREQRNNRNINYRDHSIPRWIVGYNNTNIQVHIGSSTVQYNKCMIALCSIYDTIK